MVVLSALALAAAVPSTASATKPVGECTQSYSPYTFDEWLGIADDPEGLTAVFNKVNQNGDGLICFKFYPNAPHQGIFLGNLVDNTAAPHT